MKYKISLCLSALCFFTAFLLSLSLDVKRQEALASRIAPAVLRLHILADSNAKCDQAEKLAVRNLILEYIGKQNLNYSGKEELTAWLSQHKEELESMSEALLRERGVEKEVRLELASAYFPTKAYGDMVFPCGTYDAARFIIGKGKGRNWWCLLYPSLCVTGAAAVWVPEESKEILSERLSEKDYRALLTPERSVSEDEFAFSRTIAEQKKPEIRFRSRLLTLLFSPSSARPASP